MKFSIVTPSFRSSNWLKLCIASVADQEQEAEHLIQDALSDDGTLDWLPNDSRVNVVVEPDLGMYDAINRGLRRAKGEILSYLNSDEQYLPNTLGTVGRFFDEHPTIDVVFGDAIVVDTHGRSLCHRRAMIPTETYTQVSGSLSVFSCAMFFRRRILETGLWFDPRWRALGDADWILRLIRHRVPMALLHRFTSVYTHTGENLSLSPRAQGELKELSGTAPKWAVALRKGVVTRHRLRKLMLGHYKPIPVDYSIFTLGSPLVRVPFYTPRSTGRWMVLPRRHP